MCCSRSSPIALAAFLASLAFAYAVAPMLALFARIHARRLRSVRREDDRVIVEVQANAFLHHMVRNIVGSLLPVGRGERPEDWLRQLLEGRDRTVAGPTAPSAGLVFLGPRYPAECGLPAEVTL